MNEKSRVLTIPQVAKELQISIGLAYTLVRNGTVPGRLLLGEKRICVSRSIFEKWVNGTETTTGQGDK